jgi:mono/diheme cytochrome c family protein
MDGSMGTSGTGGAAGDAGVILPDGGGVDGREVFRNDTFGDEQFWTGTLKMNDVVEGVAPTAALGLGLKVDSDLVPMNVLMMADLTAPATTVALLKLNAVVGVRATVDANNQVTAFGITCALCHSDVDNSVQAGIGKRRDGYANRDLDPGKIIALSPAITPAQKTVLNAWGAGKYDARWNQDGMSKPLLIPPIYGLKDVQLETSTGDGPISYWNSYVAVTQMGGMGQFFEPRTNVRVIRTPDLVTPKLPALYDYQVSLAKPAPAAGSFDATVAARGKTLFEGAKAKCSTCHTPPLFTDAPRLHTPAEVGQEPVAAQRSATKMYRTTPLRALAQHPPYFHDGSAATLPAVVTHYNTHMTLGLTAAEQTDLVEYLKSL